MLCYANIFKTTEKPGQKPMMLAYESALLHRILTCPVF